MSKVPWTAGPWRTYGDGGICTVENQEDGNPYDYPVHEYVDYCGGGVNGNANARLIAQAPSLYDALEQAVERLEMIEEIDRSRNWLPACSAAIVYARIVMARARGES